LILASSAGAFSRQLGRTGASEICARGQAGIEEDGQIRVLCLERASVAAARRAGLCGGSHPLDLNAGQLASIDLCPVRIRSLPLGTLRALGLPIQLNAVSAADLEQLPGIGPQLARRIVEARRLRGGFGSVEDLIEVQGIGPAKIAALRAALNPAGL
jgi:competence ComEA-like helix-hairpin-helix protein